MASPFELQVQATAKAAADPARMLSARAPLAHSLAEERANYLTHGAGVLLSLVGVAVLLKFAAERGPGALVACSVYGLTLVLMFASSTAYHAVNVSNERAKRALRTLDHSAIFLLISGTYSALSLAVPRTAAALALLSLVWLLSALGIAALARRRGRTPGGPVVFYLALSALVALSLPALRGPLGATGWWLLSLGGIVYALGVPFYLARRMRYHHVVWHAFVLVASALHFAAVLGYVARIG